MTRIEHVDPPVDRLVEDAPWIFEDVGPSFVQEVKLRFSYWDETERELGEFTPGTAKHATLTAVKAATADSGESVRRTDIIEKAECSYTESAIHGALGRLWKRKLVERHLQLDGNTYFTYSVAPAGEQLLEEYGPYEE